MKKTENPPTTGAPFSLAEYADGEWYDAEQGVDYDDPEKFVNAAKTWAHRKGYLFRRRAAQGAITFRLVPR